jgi:hypothetical protein
LATILDGKHAIGDEHGILALVEVMEVSHREEREMQLRVFSKCA